MQLQEMHTILNEINAEAVAGVKAAISRAQKVCCYGVGREGLVLKAFATRLHHMRVKVSLTFTIAVAHACTVTIIVTVTIMVISITVTVVTIIVIPVSVVIVSIIIVIRQCSGGTRIQLGMYDLTLSS